MAVLVNVCVIALTIVKKKSKKWQHRFHFVPQNEIFFFLFFVDLNGKTEL